VIVKKGNINFEKFPVAPLQFDILKIERRKKKKTLEEGTPKGVPFVFGERFRVQGSPVWGDEREKNGE
jgi:hypothetical protein